ncbi:hypothetical protein EV175_006256, partial [Coemansia sp. RSA 1933]
MHSNGIGEVNGSISPSSNSAATLQPQLGVNGEPRTHLVPAGRPSHNRIVSDTNSDASSSDGASDSSFGAYGNPNSSRPQVAMKAPRSNPAAIAATAAAPADEPRQQQKPHVQARPIYDDDSSDSAMSAGSEDDDFVVSDAANDNYDNDMDDDLDDSPVSDGFDNSSDDDWGTPKRKRKQKKPAATKAIKRVKGGGVRSAKRSADSSQTSLLKFASRGTPPTFSKQRRDDISDSDDSDFL